MILGGLTNKAKRQRGFMGKLFRFLFSIGGLVVVFFLAVNYSDKIKPELAGLHPTIGNLMDKLSGTAGAEKPISG